MYVVIFKCESNVPIFYGDVFSCKSILLITVNDKVNDKLVEIRKVWKSRE